MVELVFRRSTGSDRKVYNDCLQDKEWRHLYGLHFDDEELAEVIKVFAPLNSRELRCFICELNGEVIGFINLLNSAPNNVILSGGLLPCFRESGFGTILYAHIINYIMRNLPIEAIVVNVEKDNVSSLKLQSFFGFSVEGDAKHDTKATFLLTKSLFLNKTLNNQVFCEIIARYPCEVQDE